MDRLLALPIRGEAFLLERGRRAILVDGGFRSNEVARALRIHAPAVKALDIVVCTHADLDHAGGLVDLASSIPVREFWLPGSWAELMPELLANPKGVADGLVRELDTFVEHGEASAWEFLEPSQVEQHFHSLAMAERENHRDRTSSNVPAEQMAEEILWEVRTSRRAAARAFASARAKIWYRFRQSVPSQVARYWSGLVSTAERIRKIAISAIENGARVRWFDFERFAAGAPPTGGDPGLLIPVNSVEWFPQKCPGFSYMAKLTPVNEECLVFLAPPEINHLGVVFCGDSPLGIGRGYKNSFLARTEGPAFGVAVTAPHHGSESNSVAYGHLQAWSPILGYIRAGGSSQHPGRAFRALPSSGRVCTHCEPVLNSVFEA